jgi:glycine C-acetyltransferase
MPTSDKTQFLENNLAELKQQGLFNDIRILESAVDAYVMIGGQRYLNLTSNNYLGLANHPRLKAAAKHAIDTYGIGPAAVRSIAGTTTLHDQLETRLAAFKHVEAALTFQGGFMANLATIATLTGEGDLIFSDELNHASIIDGCRLSKARVIRYAHNDPEDLEAKIQDNAAFQRGLIITDGVFSMDGDIAPLPALAQVAAKHDNVLLMVDDAHGEGVLGRGGRGIVDHFGLHGVVDLEVGTMSKAFGVVGGMVAGKRVIIDWLKQRARPFLFSSAMTIPDVAACLEAVTVLEESDALVARLWDNARFFKDKLVAAGFNLGRTQSPILPVLIGEAHLTRTFAGRLFDEGIFVMPIVYPTVPLGTSRVRIMNSATHTRDDLSQAAEKFIRVGKSLNIT